MDAQEQLVWDAEIAVGVMGNSAGEFLLFPLTDGRPLSEGDLLNARLKGMAFVGTLAFGNGTFGAKTENPQLAHVMFPASLEFADYVVTQLKSQDNGVEFLQRLFNLPDNRREMN